MKKSLEANEIQRIESNLQALKQLRFKNESLVFALNQSKEYYLNLVPSLIEIKTRCLSFYYDYTEHFRTDTAELNISDKTRELHTHLRTAYKETGDYFSELHDLAKIKSETALSSEPANKKTTKYNQDDLEFIKVLLPKINEFITDNSIIEDWENLLKLAPCKNIMKLKCRNILLAKFLCELLIKRNIHIADICFGEYFGINERFMEVARRTTITSKHIEVLSDIFSTVQK